MKMATGAEAPASLKAQGKQMNPTWRPGNRSMCSQVASDQKSASSAALVAVGMQAAETREVHRDDVYHAVWTVSMLCTRRGAKFSIAKHCSDLETSVVTVGTFERLLMCRLH
jgi:hypothetical protein